MRVALLQDHLRNGGTEQQSLAIAEGLANQGMETHLVVFRQGGALDELARSKPFRVSFLNQGPLKTDWFAPGLAHLLDRLDVDAILPMGRMANCHAGLLCGSRRRRYRIVATFRTGRRAPYPYRRALRQADHLVANSQEALRRLAEAEGIRRPESSSVIYNGCVRDFSMAVPSLRAESAAKRDAIRLCSLSMFRPEKQQIRLVRLCAGLPDDLPWILTLAGDGPCRSACQAEARRLGVEDRVRFPGLLRDPRGLYFESDIALHASDRESLPNFLVEAQMAGLPVIAFDVNGVGETFVDGESGFLIPRSQETLFGERLVQLARDAALQQSMSEVARTQADRRFSLAAQTAAYVRLLQRLAGKI